MLAAALPCALLLSLQAPLSTADGGTAAVSDSAPKAEAPRQAGPDLSELAQQLKRSVVGMEMDLGKAESQGSGFIIRPDGWIVTNHHVIEGASTITVVNHLGERIPVVGIIAQSEAHDLAIVKVARENLPALTLGDSSTALQGSRVVLLGNPVGLGFSLSEGIVSAIRAQGVPDAESDRKSWKQRLIQTTAPISPGSSGSPAVNLQREVVGIAMGIHTRGQNLGFLVPVERLRELIAQVEGGTAEGGEVGGNVKMEEVGGFPVTNLVISLVFFAALGVAWFWLRRPKKKPAAKRAKQDWAN
jgi:S1-C subfamily serine protease